MALYRIFITQPSSPTPPHPIPPSPRAPRKPVEELSWAKKSGIGPPGVVTAAGANGTAK